MPLLLGGPRSRKLAQGVAERLVVCDDEKLVAFQHQAKVAYGGVDSQQLPVEHAVATASLRRRIEETKTNDESVVVGQHQCECLTRRLSS